LPNGLKENDRLPHPIITPTTKASSGHDQDISKSEILNQKLITERDYLMMEHFTHELFSRGTAMAAAQGLILVDTKYEFGTYGQEVILIDEIHTPDSSRYFYANGYQERQQHNQPQKQLSKEFVREWLMENNFQGQTDQVVPQMTTEVVKSISERYIELHDKILGEPFIVPEHPTDIKEIEHCILGWFQDTTIS